MAVSHQAAVTAPGLLVSELISVVSPLALMLHQDKEAKGLSALRKPINSFPGSCNMEALISTLAANPEWTLHTSEVPQNMVLNHR